MTYESTKERISQFVAEIEVEPRAISEGAMVAMRGLEDTLNNYTQIRPYVKSDPNLFWKPLPTEEYIMVDTNIRDFKRNSRRKRNVENGETFTKDLVHGSRAVG